MAIVVVRIYIRHSRIFRPQRKTKSSIYENLIRWNLLIFSFSLSLSHCRPLQILNIHSIPAPNCPLFSAGINEEHSMSIHRCWDGKFLSHCPHRRYRGPKYTSQTRPTEKIKKLIEHVKKLEKREKVEKIWKELKKIKKWPNLKKLK